MDRQGVRGWTTATVCVLGLDRTLHIANLGDSGIVLVRNGKVLHKTEPSMHTPTCPKQLGTKANRASDSETATWQVMEGDVLLLCSDGVWDNVCHDDVAHITQVHTMRQPVCSMAIAEEIGAAAYNKMCGRAGQNRGRPDDVTCVVAQVLGDEVPGDEEPAAKVVHVQHRGVGKL